MHNEAFCYRPLLVHYWKNSKKSIWKKKKNQTTSHYQYYASKLICLVIRKDTHVASFNRLFCSIPIYFELYSYALFNMLQIWIYSNGNTVVYHVLNFLSCHPMKSVNCPLPWLTGLKQMIPNKYNTFSYYFLYILNFVHWNRYSQ